MQVSKAGCRRQM